MSETDSQAERLLAVGTRQLMQCLFGEEGDLVVIFQLVGGLRDASRRDRTKIVIPPVDAFIGL